VADHRESAWSEGGDLIIPRDEGLIDEVHVLAELGEVVAGQVSPRSSSEDVTFFKSVGNAVQDVVVARRAIELAIDRGIGTDVSLG